MLLTFKTKLVLTPEQTDLIEKMSNEARQLYNYFLNQKIEFYNQNKKYLNFYTQQKELKNYKTEYLTYDAKKEVLRTLEFNFKSFFALIKKDSDARPPKFRGYKYFFTLSFVQDFIIKNNQLIISCLQKQNKKINLKLEYTAKINALQCLRKKTQSDFKQIKISKEKNKYFVSIIYEKNIIEKENKGLISIDLGKKNLASIYLPNENKGIILNAENLKKNNQYHDKRIDELKSKRDLKKKKSRKWNKLNNKKRKLEKKKIHQRNLIYHKLSKEIVDLDTNIIIGKLLNIKEACKSNFKKVNREMQNNWAIGIFINLLKYKTALKGNKLVEINEAWTSKTCCKCGSVNYDLTLQDREYLCECGLKINRDLNGAINIYKNFLGDYNTPIDFENLTKSERFDWCKTNQMNNFYLKVI